MGREVTKIIQQPENRTYSFKKVKELGLFSHDKGCQRNKFIMAFSKKCVTAKMQIYFLLALRQNKKSEVSARYD